MPKTLSPPPEPTRRPTPFATRPPPLRRRSDDPDPARERALWTPPVFAAALLALSLLASALFPGAFPDTLPLVAALALNIAIVFPVAHLIVEQRLALRGPERRRGRKYLGL